MALNLGQPLRLPLFTPLLLWRTDFFSPTSYPVKQEMRQAGDGRGERDSPGDAPLRALMCADGEEGRSASVGRDPVRWKDAKRSHGGANGDATRSNFEALIIPDLGAKDIGNQGASLLYFWDGQRAMNLFPAALRRNNTSGS